MNFTAILGLVVSAALAGTTAYGQTELGTKSKEQTFSADYLKAIDTAFPAYENAVLQKRLDALRIKYPAGREAMQINSPEQIEKIFSLPHATMEPTKSRIVLPEREYGVDRARGRVFLFQRLAAPVAPIQTSRLQQIKPQIVAYHEDVLKRIGIPSDEIFYKRTDVILGQDSTAPGQPEQKKSDPVVHGIQTYVLRSVDGIQVDGGSARLVSTEAGRLDLLDARWAPFALAPQSTPTVLRSRDEIKSGIAEKVKQFARGAKASIRMAVVMRRVESDGQSYYVPAMKVGVRTEGEGEGAVFYEPLSNHPLVEPKHQGDTPSGGEGR